MPAVRPDNGMLDTWANSHVNNKRKDLYIRADTDYRDDKWHMWTFVWDGGETIKARVYVDGKPVNPQRKTDTLDLSSLPWSASQTRGNILGRGKHYWHQPYRDYRFFDGNLDDLAIFDSLLSDEQVKAVYDQGRAATPDALAVTPERMWTFDGTVDSRSPAWVRTSTAAATVELRAQVKPQSSKAMTFAFTPDDTNTIHEFARFTIAQDSDVLLPKADALPGNESTFELLSSGPVAVSIAPGQELIDRRMSNASQYWRGWTPIKWAHPLSIYSGEQRQFALTLCNLRDRAVKVELKPTGRSVAISSVPDSVEIPAHGRLVVPISVRGLDARAGMIQVAAIAPNGVQAVGKLDIRVVGTTIDPAELANVKSVRMIFDSHYSPGTVGAKITLNGTAVGELPGNGGYSSWTVRQPYDLTDAAAALKPENVISIDTNGRHFKMRNVALELTLSDGRVIQWQASEQRTQSVPEDWPAAEGDRLHNGTPMIWHVR